MFYNTPKMWGTLMRTGALLLALIATTPALAENSTWQPSASERLVKLPGNYIKKAIDQDFQGSALATALGDIGSRISNKTQTLEDLRSATEQAEGEAHDELQQQLLAEKQEYIKLMGERQGLSRKQINTKVRLYEALLRKLELRGKGTNQSNQKLAQNQEVAKHAVPQGHKS